MIGTLTRRIETTCGEDLSVFRRQLNALAWQDIREGGVEGAATAMARKPSCVNHGVSVGVVGYAGRPVSGGTGFMISVALHVHPGRAGSVYWEEADAWAHAVAGQQWSGVERRGGVDHLHSRVFHYALTVEAAPAAVLADWSVPEDAAT
jgi:hypothetical protein